MKRFPFLWIIQALLLIGCIPFDAWSAANTPIAVIIPARETGKNITKESLSLIYRRKKLFWDSGKKIYPANLPTENPLRQRFSLAVLGQRPEDLQNYWNDMYFHALLPPYVLPSATAVQRFVADTPGAVGYVDYCDASKDPDVFIALILHDADDADHVTSDITCRKK